MLARVAAGNSPGTRGVDHRRPFAARLLRGLEPLTGNAHDVDLDAEFDRQVGTLVEKGYPRLAGLTSGAFAGLLAPLRAGLPGPARDPVPGRTPFVIVVTSDLVGRDRSFPLVHLQGRPGFTTMAPDDLARFVPLADLPLPPASAYLLVDVDTGRDTLDVPPDDALPAILAAGRSPLSVDEGIALVTHHPDVLLGSRFSLLGSRCGDRRVTAIWVSRNRPRLGWCWAGAPHTWLGSASCGRRTV